MSSVKIAEADYGVSVERIPILVAGTSSHDFRNGAEDVSRRISFRRLTAAEGSQPACCQTDKLCP